MEMWQRRAWWLGVSAEQSRLHPARSRVKWVEMARSLQLDTIKGILLVLVVLAHSMEVALEGTAGRAGGAWGVLYASIYLFHMPVFVFVSGYLTNPAKDVLRHAREILLLYVAAQAVWVAYEVVLGLTVSRELLPGGYEVILVGPGWGLWYLLSLFFWRAMTPVLAAVRWPVPALLALCGLAALAGRLELSGLLSLARTVSFLPFFAAGLWARQHGWWLTERRFRWTDAVLIPAALAVMPWLVQTSYEKTHELTYMSRPFEALGVSLADGVAFRLGMLLVGIVFARLFFWAVPAVGGVFARIGATLDTMTTASSGGSCITSPGVSSGRAVSCRLTITWLSHGARRWPA